VTPVESKLRPQKMWMGFCRFKEKTEKLKMEVRRRGEVVSDEEEALGARRAWRKEREAKEKREDVWKRSKKVKTKIQHKTYKQILVEVGQDMPASSSLGQIINVTGAVVHSFL
jgi:tuftelin-interacting protein 11